MNKSCSKCKKTKPKSAFITRKERNGALHSWCNECLRAHARNWRRNNPEKEALHQKRAILKRKYNITIDGYNELLINQGGMCAICGTRTPGGSGGFCIDHDHGGGKVRGLLCTNCNLGIGHLQDSEYIIESALNYIKYHNSGTNVLQGVA